MRKPGEHARTIDNSPDYVPSAYETSLRRLGIERIDLYYVHRIDRSRPIGEVMQAAFAEGDFRAALPRFSATNMTKNRSIVDLVQETATRKDCTPAQVALAWLLSKGDDIVPIPGT